MQYPVGATPLDPDELAGLKYKHVKTRNELDHLEQANIEDGLRWVHGIDILTAINDGDSRELGSWLVPGSSPRLFSITFATPSYALAPQAITACPAANMFNAAFISACSV